MRLLHTAAKTGASFDDLNLVSYAGLVPAVRLVENVGLEDLVASHVRVAAKVGANPGVKVGSLVAGMVSPAWTASTGWIFCGTARSRPPSVGSAPLRRWARSCGRSTTPTVRQLAAVHRRMLARLAARGTAAARRRHARVRRCRLGAAPRK
jgi:hypothetical protein